MLTHLAIQDFAVVRAAELDFGPGLTVISGETGAGKSLLVDALGFLSGARADSGVVRHGAERAELIAVFALADAPEAAGMAARTGTRRRRPTPASCAARCAPTAARRPGSTGGRRRSRNWPNSPGAARRDPRPARTPGAAVARQPARAARCLRPPRSATRRRAGRCAPLVGAACANATRCSQRGDPGDRIAFLEHQLAELRREALEPEAFADLVATHTPPCARRRPDRRVRCAPARASAATTVRRSAASCSRCATNSRARPNTNRAWPTSTRCSKPPPSRSTKRPRCSNACAPTSTSIPAPSTRSIASSCRLHDLARKHRVTPDALAAQRDALDAELERTARRGRTRARARRRNRRRSQRAGTTAATTLDASAHARPPTALVERDHHADRRTGHGRRRVLRRHRTQRRRRPRPAGRRTHRIPRRRQPRPTAARAAQGRLGRRTLAHLAGDRSRRARPGRRADDGVRRSGFGHRRRGRRHRRPETARARRASARCCASPTCRRSRRRAMRTTASARPPATA